MSTFGPQLVRGSKPDVVNAHLDCRPVNDQVSTILMGQRVQREVINARSAAKFSIRASVTNEKVPMKFKTGHSDPSKERKLLGGFDPATVGWDPDGREARLFRRCMDEKRNGPRDRFPIPQTANQDLGWLLSDKGDFARRMRRRSQDRMGIGWICPDEYVESAATANPPAIAVASEGSVASAAPPSQVSAAAPCSKQVETAASSPIEDASLSTLSHIPPSQISMLSSATSLPALRNHPADMLRYREANIQRRMQEAQRYLNTGDRGREWFRPNGSTDATAFESEFIKASGLPLYKTFPKEELVLTNPRTGAVCDRWR